MTRQFCNGVGAEKTGFTTPSYFSTAFKQYTGETPSQYKERKKKGLAGK